MHGNTLNTNAVAQILNINKNTVRKWTNLGILNAQRRGPRRDRIFKQEDIDAYLAQNIKVNKPIGQTGYLIGKVK